MTDIDAAIRAAHEGARCDVCGTEGIVLSGPNNSPNREHRAPCGRMCATTEGWPGQVHDARCPCLADGRGGPEGGG